MANKKYVFQPNYAIHPGEYLEELLEVRGMSQAELAIRLGISRKHISNVVNGKASITAELAHALKNIYRSSRNALEENGANTLFVALGMLKWYENDRSQQPRFAPVILMPVDIIRKSYSNYLIRTRDEETIINITILELLKQQCNINLTALSPTCDSDSI